MTTTPPIPSPTADVKPTGRQYWAVHLRLIDNILPMASYDSALTWAEKTNAEWAAQNAGRTNVSPVDAVVIPSPWSGEEHFARCAGTLTHVLTEGDRIISQIMQANHSLSAHINLLKVDAERYAFHRAVSYDNELIKNLTPIIEEKAAHLEEATTAEEVDAVNDALRALAIEAGFWPPKAPQPALDQPVADDAESAA